MAVPARRTSKTRKRLRRTHYKLQVPGMSACPNCGELRKAQVGGQAVLGRQAL